MPALLKRVFNQWMLNFVKWFFLIYWDDPVIFIYFDNTVYHIHWFVNDELSFCPWNKTTWSHYMILLICCWIWLVNILLRIFKSIFIKAAAKLLQLCPTLCDPIDGSPPGSFIPGILQARTLEWVAMSFSKAWKWRVKVKSLSRVRLLVTPWTTAYQASPPMGFSRQEY